MPKVIELVGGEMDLNPEVDSEHVSSSLTLSLPHYGLYQLEVAFEALFFRNFLFPALILRDKILFLRHLLWNRATSKGMLTLPFFCYSWKV